MVTIKFINLNKSKYLLIEKINSNTAINICNNIKQYQYFNSFCTSFFFQKCTLCQFNAKNITFDTFLNVIMSNDASLTVVELHPRKLILISSFYVKRWFVRYWRKKAKILHR